MLNLQKQVERLPQDFASTMIVREKNLPLKMMIKKKMKKLIMKKVKEV
jgi:hypothetical protein